MLDTQNIECMMEDKKEKNRQSALTEVEVMTKEVDEKNQTIKAEMEVGSQDEDVYFQYYKNKSGDYVFTGSIDLLQMGFSKAYYALDEICGDMHTGKDGVKKSWPVVDIEVTAKIK